MLCLKKRRTYSFTQGVCTELPRRSKEDNHRYEGSLNMAITTLPRKNRTREERPSRMVLTVTEDTPADMLAGSMELLVQLPRDHHLQTQRVTVQRSTPMMDLLVQIATAHKLTASNYTLQAIGERGIVLPHQPNTPIGALDALQVKLLPKQGTFVTRKAKQANQPFETTFRLQVHLPRNQLYVSRVSPKMNLGEILEEVCREKDLDKNKYELRHPANLDPLDLSLSLQDYHLQEVTLYAKQARALGSALSTQDIMALQRQEERRRQQAKQGVFGFAFKKSKEGSLSTDSLGGRSASPARSDETGRSTSPLQMPTRPQRKRRPAPKPPTQGQAEVNNGSEENSGDSSKDKVVISHSRNSSDSSGYHEASVLSDNPDSAGRLPETLPRRNRAPLEMPRKLAQTSQSSKSLSNLASVPGTLSHGISNTSLSSTGLRKKRAAPPPPVTRPLSSAISTQALERIVDSEESLTSDMDPSKPPSDIGIPSKANSDIEERPKASSDIGITTVGSKLSSTIDFTKSELAKAEIEAQNGKSELQSRHRSGSVNVKLLNTDSSHAAPVKDAPVDARVPRKRVGEPVPLPKPRKRPEVPKRKLAPPSPLSRTLSSDSSNVDSFSIAPARPSIGSSVNDASSSIADGRNSVVSVESSDRNSTRSEEKLEITSNYSTSEDEVFFVPGTDRSRATFDCNSIILEQREQNASVDVFEKDTDGRIGYGCKLVKDADGEINYGDISAKDRLAKDGDGKISYGCKLVKDADVEINCGDASAKDEDEKINYGDDLSVEEDKENMEIRSSQSLPESERSSVTMRNNSERNSFDYNSVILEEKIENASLNSSSKDTSENVNYGDELASNKDGEIDSGDKLSLEQNKGSSEILLRNEQSSLAAKNTFERNSFDYNSIILEQKKQNASLDSLPKNNNGKINYGDELMVNGDKENLEIPSKSLPSNEKLVENISQRDSFDYNSITLEQNQNASLNSLPKDTKEEINYGDDLAKTKAKKINSGDELSLEEDKESPEIISNKSLPISDQNSLRSKSSGKNSASEKRLCAVISTMPKCDHLNALKVETTIAQNKEREGSKDPKKARIPRTASKSNDFETNSLERQKRHLTSHAEDITFALNLNVTSVGLLSSDSSRDIDEDLAQHPKEDEDGCRGVGEGNLAVCSSETDVLLQKVSDTLSNSLPVSSPNELPITTSAHTKSGTTKVSKETDQKNKKNTESPEAFALDTSTPNLTVNSQQDTSDYVSAADEDLSVAEWEYQLPAPPSAFRDSASPVFDKFEAVTSSPEFFGDPETNDKDAKHLRRQENKEIEIRKKEALQGKLFKQLKSESSLKKEVINELENKIGTQKDSELKKISNDPSTPKIAPVDNTLKNFTITTYSRQKNLNIFEEVQKVSKEKNSDERFIKSFATLARNRSNSEENEDKKVFSVGTLQGKKRLETEESNVGKKVEPKMQAETLQRWQSGNEKTNIQRSKSYMSVCDKPNVQENGSEEEEIRNERNLEMDGMKKATSISNLNATAPKSNEKFSQWRDNILKRQENPTKEKQLQSLQVLKSILPQLKNAQQAEENVSKEPSDPVLPEKPRSETTSSEHSKESNAVSAREPQAAPSTKKVEPPAQKAPSETNPKRYIYSRPPIINLGSWSERASANVQIKKDTDYKFASTQANGKTVININGTKDEVDATPNYAQNSASKLQGSNFEVVSSSRREPNELAKKLITHTTASGFKKTVLNKVNTPEAKISNDKPVVTGVELKKSFLENSRQDENVIDTTPVNFKELTKAFGQDVTLRPKSKRSNTFQQSDSQNGHVNAECLNGHQESAKPKRYTSIVGIQSQNQGNLAFRNGINMKGSQPMPVVKGFKFTSNAKIDATKESSKEGAKELSREWNNGTQPPRPPTMPVITGVTLKSARPKSMPDRRDVLLESIRNFGGRENLKSAAERS